MAIEVTSVTPTLMDSVRCSFSSPNIQVPCIGLPGLPGHGLTNEQLEKVQRFWPSKFSEYLLQLGVYRADGDYRVKDSQSCESPLSYVQCDHIHTTVTKDMLQDTIGFFIAKFVKLWWRFLFVHQIMLSGYLYAMSTIYSCGFVNIPMLGMCYYWYSGGVHTSIQSGTCMVNVRTVCVRAWTLKEVALLLVSELMISKSTPIRPTLVAMLNT